MNADSERALLGACLLEPERIPEVSLIVSPEDFLSPSNAEVFSLLLEMQKNREDIDIVTVNAKLPTSSASDIAGLVDSCPAPFHATSYAEMVVESSKRHRLFTSIEDIKSKLVQNEIDSSAAMLSLDESIRKLSLKQSAGYTMREVTAKIIAELELIGEGGDLDGEISTGMNAIDDGLGGLKRQELFVLAGRPSMGKTALACNIARNVAAAGDSVALVTIESPKEKIANRLISAASGVENNKLQSRKPNDTEIAKAIVGARAVGELSIHLLDKQPRWDFISAWIRSVKLRDPTLAMVVLALCARTTASSGIRS